jgi:aldose 1-epimerase
MTAPGDGAAAAGKRLEGLATGDGQEGTVRAYSSFEEYELADYLTGMARDLPHIRVEVKRMPTSVLATCLLEQAAAPGPGNDIVLGWAATAMQDPRILALLEPEGVQLGQTLGPAFRDPGGRWFSPTGFVTAFAVNTERARRLALPTPRTWNDLLDPRLRGELVMPDPRVSGAGYLLATAVLQHLGAEAGWAFLRALDRQVAEYPPSAWLPVEAAGRGGCTVALSVGIAVVRAMAGGAPLELVIPGEGAGFEPEVFAMMRGARNKPAARQVLEWMAGPAALPLYRRYRKVLLVGAGASPTAPGLESAAIRPIDVPAAAAAKPAFAARWDAEIAARPGRAAPADARAVRQELLGHGPDGLPVHRYRLSSQAGLSAEIINYGATLAALRVRDTGGQLRNVVLGFRSLAQYQQPHPRLGATMGRFSNRIAGASFTLDGVVHRVTANNGVNSIHGGNRGFDKVVWREVELGDTADGGHLALEYVSADGEEGFPGTLRVRVTYSVSASDLRIDYRAETDRATVVNLTNHAYFNLNGEGAGSILDHQLMIHADSFAGIDADLIPTGELVSVEGTPLDFRTPVAIGARIRQGHQQIAHGRGYDHNFLIDGPPDRSAGGARLAGWVASPVSGLKMQVFTTEPALLFNSGNVLPGGLIGASGVAYRQSDGLCLETQKFPDSPNQPAFPSSVVRPGEPLRSHTIYRFSLTDR